MKRMYFFILLGCVLPVLYAGAYTFSFSNHTAKQLKVRIKLAPVVFEDWSEEKVLGSKDDADTRTISFEVGGPKVGFCLSQIQYSAQDVPWTPAVVQWVEGTDGQQFDRMLRAAEFFADGLADVAQAVVYETVSAETVQKLEALQKKKQKIENSLNTLSTLINASPEELETLSRAELEKQVRERFIRSNIKKIKAGNPEIIAQQQKIKDVLEQMSIDELELADTSVIKSASKIGDRLSLKTAEGSDITLAQKKNDTKALVPYQQPTDSPLQYQQKLAAMTARQPQSFHISDVINVTGNLIKYSWCKSLHFDVVEDTEGIKFLVKVGQ